MDTIFSLNGIDSNKLFDATIKWLLGPGIRVILIVILAWEVIRLGRIFIKRSVALAFRETHRDAIADAQTAKRRATLDSLFATNSSRLGLYCLRTDDFQGTELRNWSNPRQRWNTGLGRRHRRSEPGERRHHRGFHRS